MEEFATGKIIVFFRRGVDLDNFLKICKKNGIKWIGGKEATRFNPRKALGIYEDLGLRVTEGGMVWNKGEGIREMFIYADEKLDAIIKYQE